jgi:hypothetical protein
MPGLDEERRRATRYRLVAPVELRDGSMGQALDMSTCGVFFETEQTHSCGVTIGLSVIFDDCTVHCEGRVVRVEPMAGAFGIALELEFYDFA